MLLKWNDHRVVDTTSHLWRQEFFKQFQDLPYSRVTDGILLYLCPTNTGGCGENIGITRR